MANENKTNQELPEAANLESGFTAPVYIPQDKEEAKHLTDTLDRIRQSDLVRWGNKQTSG